MINRWMLVFLFALVLFITTEVYHLTTPSAKEYFTAFVFAIATLTFCFLIFVIWLLLITALRDVFSDIKDFPTGY